MSTLRGWFLEDKKQLPADFGVSTVAGTSLTIPGQGSDLALIIQSIVKLPPLDERTFDSQSSDPLDEDRLFMQAEMDSLYTPTAVNMAEDANARIKSKSAKKEESSGSADAEVPDKDEE